MQKTRKAAAGLQLVDALKSYADRMRENIANTDEQLRALYVDVDALDCKLQSFQFRMSSLKHRKYVQEVRKQQLGGLECERALSFR